MNLLREINWIEKNKIIDNLLGYNTISSYPLIAGLEAEVAKICLGETCYVLKIWNKKSKPNIQNQYKIIRTLYENGLTVPQPMGYGRDKDMNQVLLTSYNGSPVNITDNQILLNLASILNEVHKTPLELFDPQLVLEYDFIKYFYPGVEEHADIHELLVHLVKKSNMKNEQLIHGDYNLGNILESEGTYTIIDWTNGQRGDPRYDIAWSVILIQIYTDKSYASLYRNDFLNIYTRGDLELFEAIACLRWILLNRIVNLSKGIKTIRRVREILKENVHLHEGLL
ncbi:aminoglycoside phosphotransferase family protein [Paenibacillus senegalensis]|uniref:aminoglycoside phosphotransferase family protein n=1 Tax=Paenibacillus senegalensis TaxID=1465766 RepID=UPI000289BD9D|nr:aminoglycoside phosphotransferase family protein [Paenibacillus senegalensis]